MTLFMARLIPASLHDLAGSAIYTVTSSPSIRALVYGLTDTSFLLKQTILVPTHSSNYRRPPTVDAQVEIAAISYRCIWYCTHESFVV